MPKRVGNFILDEINDGICCDGMRAALSSKWCRGLSIEKGNNEIGEVRYLIYSRGVDKEDVDKLAASKISIDIKMNLETHTGIRFCPWCGKQLVC